MNKEKIFDSSFDKDFGLLQYDEDPLPSDSRFNEEIIYFMNKDIERAT